MKKGLIFDLDGTLWDSINTILPNWNSTIKSFGIDKVITYDEFASYMGKRIEEIADICLPDAPNRREIMYKCCEGDKDCIREKGGILYPELEATLTSLKEKYHLFVVSNCDYDYLKTFLDYFSLNEYFDDIEMAGRTGKPKGENIKLIIERNHLDKAMYVGDTQGDCDATKLANIPFIFASYGFGSVDSYDYKISKFSDLLNIEI